MQLFHYMYAYPDSKLTWMEQGKVYELYDYSPLSKYYSIYMYTIIHTILTHICKLNNISIYSRNLQ